MEIKPIESNQQKPEVVRIGQRFQLFKPERTTPYEGLEPGQSYESFVALETDFLPPIKLRIDAIRIGNKYVLPSASLTPFNPEEGYTITSEDLDTKLRGKKIEEAQEKIARQPYGHAQLYLQVRDLNPKFKPTEKLQTDPNLERIKLLLFFPLSAYEGMLDPLENRAGNLIVFAHFHPLDSGFLPVIETWEWPGMSLGLPDDVEKLYQIEAMFVLAEEEPKKVK